MGLVWHVDCKPNFSLANYSDYLFYWGSTAVSVNACAANSILCRNCATSKKSLWLISKTTGNLVMRNDVEENLRLVDEGPEAFNAHDLESFVGFYAESAVHYLLTRRARTKSEVRNLNEISHVSRATIVP